MKVHLIRKETIEAFAKQNIQSRSSLEEWLMKIKQADWQKPADIRSLFKSADLLGNSSARVIFNIAGNNYRMICRYAFGEKNVHLYVCWIGTHSAYDVLSRNNEQYTIRMY